jgi:hypothetical protein
MGPLRVVVQPHAPDHLKQLIQEGLGLYNVAATGLSEYYPVSIFLKDATDEGLGGVLGHIWGGWLSIAIVWIAEPARRQAMGQHSCWLPRPMQRKGVARTRSWRPSASRPGRFMTSLAMRSLQLLRIARQATRNIFYASSSATRVVNT